MKNPASPGHYLSCRQGGVSLIEALVAALVTALGILGILMMQMRTMANTQAAVRQAQAIRLIENLSERMRMNPNSFAQGVANNYVIGWEQPIPATSCANGCAADVLARFDIQEWRKDVRAALPLADANVFLVNDESSVDAGSRRQIGVMIAWRENESSENAEDAAFNRYFRLTSRNAAGENIACPTGRTCHLQFIQLSARCIANKNSGTARPYCADGSVKTIASS